MEVREVIWLDAFVEKLWRKHRVDMDEVEEVLYERPQVRKVTRGDVAGEDVYLVVFFVLKAGARALVISARDMKPKERRQYAKR